MSIMAYDLPLLLHMEHEILQATTFSVRLTSLVPTLV
jgi:citrate synthase